MENQIRKIEETTSTDASVTTATVPTSIDRELLFERCADLAKSEGILSELDNSLRDEGFAGPTSIPQTIFLATITAVFDKPVSVAIKGPSSHGKSFALDAGLRYVPPHAYEKFQGLSDKALVHSTDLNLQHRHLVLGEAAGLANGTGRALLRQFLTEDEIRYRIVEQSQKGLAPKELHIKGPMGLFMTTTANSLHWEDETRLLSLIMDQSSDQIGRALMMIGDETAKPTSEENLSRWHVLHDYVCSGDLSAEIPYRKELLASVPTNHARVLRDMPKVLALIRAHALLHQCTRDRNKEGCVVATMSDYAVVHGLIADALAYGLQANVPPHILETVEAVASIISGPVSVTEIAELLHRDLSVVSRNVKAAIKEGYIDDENPGQGRRSKLVLGKRTLPKGAVLPDPQELKDICDGKPRKVIPFNKPDAKASASSLEERPASNDLSALPGAFLGPYPKKSGRPF